MDEGAEDRRRRFVGLINTRVGSIGLLIAIVLITQAGLVYVAVDQIGGSTEEARLIQPAGGVGTPRAPISVDAGDDEPVEAPAATRAPEVVEAEGPPPVTGTELARERAEPQGVAPPLTGSEPPAGDASSSPPPDHAAEPAHEVPPGPPDSAPPSEGSENPDETESGTESGSETESEEPHPGRGPEGDGPPGQDSEEQPGNGKGRDG